MWMNKIMIKSFGGLKDLTLSLEPGFTNLVWENEAGKSTIMDFLKMMFYGKLPGGNDVGKNLRKKYLPWDGSKMEGAIEFQVGDVSYRLEKSFGKTAAGDKVHLLKLPSGEEMKVAKDMELGQQFFNMDLAAFEKTIFIKNSGMIYGNSEKDSVAEKISNLSNGMEEETSMEEVLKRLLDAREALISKSGRSGELVRRKERAMELSSERNRLLAIEEEQKEVAALIETNQEKVSKNALFLQNLKELEKIQKIKELLDLRQEEEAAIKRKEEYFKERLFVTKEQEERCVSLKEGLNKEEALVEREKSAIQELKEQQEEKRKKKRELQSDFDAEGEEKLNETIRMQKQRLSELKQERQMALEEEKQLDINCFAQKKEEDTSQTQRKIQELEKEKERKEALEKRFGIAFFGFLFLGVVLLFFVPPVGGGLFALSILFFFLALGTRIKVRGMKLCVTRLLEEEARKEEEERRNQKEKTTVYEEKKQEFLRKNQEWMQEEERLNQELADVYERISEWKIKKEKLSSMEAELKELEEKICQLEAKNAKDLEEIQRKETELNSVLALYQVSGISQLKEEMKRQKALEDEISEKRVKVETLSSAFGMGQLSFHELRTRVLEAKVKYSEEELDISKEYMERKQKEAQQEYHSLLEERNELYQKCKKLEQNPEDLELQLQELERQNQDMQEYYDALSLAYEAMNETALELRQSFGPKLNEKTAAYFKQLTGGAYEDVLVQSDYGIMALKKGDISYRSYKYLSQGTIDQAYFALRMALIEIISTETAGQRLPLFLDDIFMQYDEARTKNGVEFLKEYAKNGQVILFTPRPVE